jgi:hypothetical protein
MRQTARKFFVTALGLLFVTNLMVIHALANSDKERFSSESKITDKKRAGGLPRIEPFFEENKGQADEKVKFLSRNAGYTLFLTANEAVYRIENAGCLAKLEKRERSKFSQQLQASKHCTTTDLRMKIIGANQHADSEGVNLLPTKINYFIGNDSERWLKNVASYQTVRYTHIYDGIDFVFRGTSEQNLEYDFHVAPQADPNHIQLEFAGAKKIFIDRAGELVLKFKGGEIRHRQPQAFQIIDGEKRQVDVRFVLLTKNRYGFSVGEYDRTKELTIDPIIYATYLGGFYQDRATDVALDSAGNIYVASHVSSSDFLIPQEEPSRRNLGDIAVTKFNPSGSTILTNTYIGGIGSDNAYAIDVDSNGNAYVAGETYSPDFPMMNARQTANSTNGGNNSEGFVTKLDASGGIIYSTYHGSPSDRYDYASSLEVDSNGNAYLAGFTSGSDFPLMNAYQNTRLGAAVGYLSKLNPTGQLMYSTFFGAGSGSWTQAHDITVDDQNNAFITGETEPQLPTTPDAYLTSGIGYVAKFNTARTGSESLVYSTYIPGVGKAVARDSAGNVYVASILYTSPSVSNHKIIKLNSSGTNALYEYKINERNFDLNDIAVDQSGRAYFIQAFRVSEYAKVTALSSIGNLFGTFSVNYANDANGIAVDSDGYAWIVGATYYRTFPTTPNAYQRQNRGNPNPYATPAQGYLAKILVEPEKTPLIFVPGTMGSNLYRRNPDGTANEKYWARWGNGFLFNAYLTLDSESSYYVPEGFIAKDAFRTVRFDGQIPIDLPGLPTINIPVGFKADTIYKKLLDELKRRGEFVEYDVIKNPTLRNPDGSCDKSQISSNPNETPTLFVFPYDFRKDNAQIAVKLKEFIQCVQEYHPNKKVNLLTHSMGGLIARRYISDRVRVGEEPQVDKLITMVAPWLGAPEALYKIETGGDWHPGALWGDTKADLGFSVGLIQPHTIKFLAEFFPSVHQLLPSRSFRDVSGFAELSESGDINGNGVPDEIYTVEQTRDFLNNDFRRSFPGTAGAFFHDCTVYWQACGQDDWRNDQSGVNYYHIFSTQYALKTTVRVKVSIEEVCSDSTGCYYEKQFYPIKYTGDGTVPERSASRIPFDRSRPTLNSEGAQIKKLCSPDAASDGLYEHNGITKNTRTHDFVLYWLGLAPEPPTITNECITAGGFNALSEKSASFTQNSNLKQDSQSTNINLDEVSDSEAYYVRIVGVSDVQVSDQDGAKFIKADDNLINSVKGLLEYKVIGNNSLFLTFLSTRTHNIEFRVGNLPLMIEAVRGTGNTTPNLAVRYKDLNLPQGVKARLTLNPQGVENLRYDANNDGTFESAVEPTVAISGSSAADMNSPTLTIDVIQQENNAIVAITGQDPQSGVGNIRYSFDALNFNNYAAPFSIAYSANPITIYAFADDNVGNRSGLYTKQFTFTSAAPTLAVRPVLECVQANANGTYTAKFGYKNDNFVSLVIPVGVNNKFSPLPQNKEQTTVFQPGRIRFAFEVAFNGSNLVWTLKGPDNQGRTSTASADSARCQ